MPRPLLTSPHRQPGRPRRGSCRRATPCVEAPAPAVSLLSAGNAAAIEHVGTLKAVPAVTSCGAVVTAARAAAVQASALTVREVAACFTAARSASASGWQITACWASG